MHSEENSKVLFDTQVYKDKLDKVKVELYDLKKRYSDVEKYKPLYEAIKAREDARLVQEI